MRTTGMGKHPTAVRTAALWVPDWPVLAAMKCRQIAADVPTAVHDQRRVIAASAPARSRGVRRGMRRRQARECCPELVFCDADDVRDAREFEQVALAAETMVAGLEIVRPGLLLLPADGAARYHGSDKRLAEALVVQVADLTGYECQVGIADGMLAAVIAARGDQLVPVGRSGEFLAHLSTRELIHLAGDQASAVDALIDLLGRLGIRTLADFAALPEPMVTSRFGTLGAWAHRLAQGKDLRPPARRRIEPDLVVEAELDPPAERVDVATFAGRRLAEKLHSQLTSRSVVAGRLQVTARTVDGGELERAWRADHIVTPAQITDRVRWQLEGWLTSAAIRDAVGHDAPTGALIHLAIAAQELVPAGAEQRILWGTPATDSRVHRALARAQGLVGGDGVLTVRIQGGRGLRDRLHLVPFGEEPPMTRDPALPWPGKLPSPAPSIVLDEPLAVELLDDSGRPVLVNARQAMNAPPAFFTVRGEARGSGSDQRWNVVQWAGPWALAERWWTPQTVRRAYVQVALDDGRALLVSASGGTWQVEGIYD